MKETIKKFFNEKNRRVIRRNLNLLKSLTHWNNLDEIGRIYETDKKKIIKLLKKMSIKDITSKISKENNISKKIVYDYCLKKKNEI